MDIYLVGGAVRDKLLGLPVEERDWVVVGATPEQMLELGYRQVGKDFPVFLHPETGEEYALARTERKTAPGYKGFVFHAAPDVSLEEDLKRRDLTINAMAETGDGQLIDPFNGRDDLTAGRLRHVSPAFSEDPVRVLRVARLAARFGRRGFSVAHSTNALMRKMVAEGEVNHLVPERVWNELHKALCTDRPEKFFSVLHGCHALAVLFPEIEREYADNDSAHTDRQLPLALERLKNSVEYSDDPRVRFAVLLSSLQPGLPVEQRSKQAESLCNRYRAPNEFSRLALNAIRLSELVPAANADALLDAMDRSGAFRDPHHWQQLLNCYRITGHIDADTASMYEKARSEAALISASDIGDSSLQGPAIGEAIRVRRSAAISNLMQQADDPA